MGAPVKVATGAVLDLLVLTCRARHCVEQWEPTAIQDGTDGVVQLSQERCPACGSSTWEVTQVQVSGSPSAAVRRRREGRRAHRSSHSGRGF